LIYNRQEKGTSRLFRAHSGFGTIYGRDLHRWLEEAGFKKIEISIVAAEEHPPHFQTILAGGEK